MSKWRQWYMRIFKGYTWMPEIDAAIVKLFFLGTNRMPGFIKVPGGVLVSKPVERWRTE